MGKEYDLEKFITEECGIDYEEYEESLRISEKGKIIVLKREVHERNVNNYNPLMLRTWEGNIDIQICTDSYAVITYITDYISKSDLGVSAILKKLLQIQEVWTNLVV